MFNFIQNFFKLVHTIMFKYKKWISICWVKPFVLLLIFSSWFNLCLQWRIWCWENGQHQESYSVLCQHCCWRWEKRRKLWEEGDNPKFNTNLNFICTLKYSPFQKFIHSELLSLAHLLTLKPNIFSVQQKQGDLTFCSNIIGGDCIFYLTLYFFRPNNGSHCIFLGHSGRSNHPV